MNDYRTIIGKRIKAYRLHLGLTLDEVGYRANLTGRFIGAIERGQKMCSVNTLSRIARALNADLTELVSLEEEPSRAVEGKEYAELARLFADLSEDDRQILYRAIKPLVHRLKQPLHRAGAGSNADSASGADADTSIETA